MDLNCCWIQQPFRDGPVPKDEQGVFPDEVPIRRPKQQIKPETKTDGGSTTEVAVATSAAKSPKPKKARKTKRGK